MEKVGELSIYFQIGTILVVACLGLWRYQQLGPGQRYLAWLAGFSLLTELVVATLLYLAHRYPSLFPGVLLGLIIPVVLLGTLSLLFLAYGEALGSPGFRRAMPWLLGAVAAYVLGDSVYRWGTQHLYVGPQVLGDLLGLGLALLYFRRLLDHLGVQKLSRDPFFIVSVGLVVYSLGDVLLILFGDYVMAHYSRFLQLLLLQLLRNFFNIVLYASYGVALWLRPAAR